MLNSKRRPRLRPILGLAGLAIGTAMLSITPSASAAAPSITTYASDTADGDKIVTSQGSITDRVTYTDLTAGSTYVLRSELVFSDGLASGTGHTVVFTATASDGVVDIVYPPLSAQIGGEVTSFVTLYTADRQTLLASHEVLGEPDQTVLVMPAKPADHLIELRTLAFNDLDSGKTVSHGDAIVDEVRYSYLLPSVTYLMRGEVMAVAEDGSVTATGVTAEQTFTTVRGDGLVEVDFPALPDSVAGTLVVYERLYSADGATLLASHEDPTDTDQTVIGPDSSDEPDGPTVPENSTLTFFVAKNAPGDDTETVTAGTHPVTVTVQAALGRRAYIDNVLDTTLSGPDVVWDQDDIAGIRDRVLENRETYIIRGQVTLAAGETHSDRFTVFGHDPDDSLYKDQFAHDLATVVASEPTETDEPTETEEPTETQEPVETEDPTETQEPTETSQTDEPTAEPTETSTTEPSLTDEPTTEPAETQTVEPTDASLTSPSTSTSTTSTAAPATRTSTSQLPALGGGSSGSPSGPVLAATGLSTIGATLLTGLGLLGSGSAVLLMAHRGRRTVALH